MGEVREAVQPRANEEPLSGPGLRRPAAAPTVDEITQGALKEDVVPASDGQCGNRDTRPTTSNRDLVPKWVPRRMVTPSEVVRADTRSAQGVRDIASLPEMVADPVERRSERASCRNTIRITEIGTRQCVEGQGAERPRGVEAGLECAALVDPVRVCAVRGHPRGDCTQVG